uniref:Uncharacterized protein n=1 Tax=Anguilla anguilla TaxID=7936 RepID=A0A0E9S9B7_ANGAN
MKCLGFTGFWRNVT